MTAARLTGTLANRHGADPRDRVVAVREPCQVVGEARVDADGRWSLEAAGPPDRVVVQLAGQRLAALAAEPSASNALAFPDLVRLVLRPEGPSAGALAWVDPIELDGFPGELVWALRAHPAEVVDLHVAQFDADTGPLELRVQPGRYRISGGRFSLHPGGPSGALLSRAVDEASGSQLVASDGAIEVDVRGDAAYRLEFAEATEDLGP